MKKRLEQWGTPKKKMTHLTQIRKHPNGYIYPSISTEADVVNEGEIRLITNSRIMAGIVLFSVPDAISLKATKLQLQALEHINQTGFGPNGPLLSVHTNFTEMQQLVSLSLPNSKTLSFVIFIILRLDSQSDSWLKRFIPSFF